MVSEKRGLFVIINNENFKPESGLNRRVGSQADVQNLYNMFTKFGFDVQTHQDITGVQAVEVLSKGLFHSAE